MLQATVERLRRLVPAERVLVLTNQRLVDPIRQTAARIARVVDHRRAVSPRHGSRHRTGGRADRTAGPGRHDGRRCRPIT